LRPERSHPPQAATLPRLTVLVATPQSQSAIACIQSLGRSGHTILVWGTLNYHPNLRSKYIAKRFERTASAIIDQVDQLQLIVENHNIDIVIPTTDQDAEVGAILNERLSRPVCVVGTVDAVRLTRDRTRSHDYCRSLDIKCPRSRRATLADVQEAADDIGYPCFIKISETIASGGVFRASNAEDLARIMSAVDASLVVQIQEEVSGHFTDITGFSVNGVIVDSFSFKARYEHSQVGTPPYAVEVRDAELRAILGKIVAGLNWTGGIDVDLLTDTRGNHHVLEINPRLSGTSVFALKLGIDFPSYYADFFHGRTSVPGQRDDARPVAHYVSVAEEAALLARSGKTSRPNSWGVDRRAMLDNTFPEDPSYNSALVLQSWWIHLSVRHPWLERAVRRVRRVVRM